MPFLVDRELRLSMTLSGSSRGESQTRTPRRYPRVPIVTPVEIFTKNTLGPPVIGRIDNLSVGGALATCRESFDVHTEVAMFFQLPTGSRIHAFGRVVYAVPQRHFGVAFEDLDRDARLQVDTFVHKALGYSRRSSRVPYRTHLAIRPSETAGSAEEQPADTVLVSRNGGLLVCSATYYEGQEIYLWSPERNRGARARVIFQHVWAGSGLVELGFEFMADEDFWKIDLPNECD